MHVELVGGYTCAKETIWTVESMAVMAQEKT